MKTRTILLTSLLATAIGAQAQVQINVDAAHPGIHVSPTLYGIFYEDINHAADGGLYAELIRNRSFEADNWTTIGNVTVSLATKGLLNAAQQHALELTFPGKSAEPAGISNEGF